MNAPMWNWQLTGWPKFTFDREALRGALDDFADAVKSVRSALEAPEDLQAVAELLTTEAVRTSAIEGVNVDESVVMSSICRVLGVPYAPLGFVKDVRAEGVAKMMLSVREDWRKPISRPLILSWHRALMSGNVQGVAEGCFRTHVEPMRVVRHTAYGEDEIRFEAPPSTRVPTEIRAFVAKWKDSPRDVRDIALKATFLHPHFESIHPFEDGNGRVGRALVAKTLAEGLGRGVVLPISVVISRHRNDYYEAINGASRSLDWTAWAEFFIPVLTETLTSFESAVRFVAAKKRYLDRYESMFSERAKKVILRVFKDGIPGVAAGLTAAKWTRMAKVSKPTATRDLAELVQMGALELVGAGKRAEYQLNLNELNVTINRKANVPIKEALLRLVSDRPGIGRVELSELLDVDVRTISRIIGTLSGFVEHRGSKKTGGYYLAEKK